jgi:hypothetical protein
LSENEDKNQECENRKVKVEDFDGVKISYEKKELEQYIPHLFSEIQENKKKVKINSVKYEIEQDSTLKTQNQSKSYPEELYNPKTIDFIRRCTNKEEAIEILDFLLKREEIEQDEYNKIKNQILKKGGLKILIDAHGGFKGPGYYEKKFRTLEEKKKKK